MSFQGDRIDLADVVGFGGGVIGISIFYDVAGSVVSEVRHGVIQKGDRPENVPENTFCFFNCRKEDGNQRTCRDVSASEIIYYSSL